METPPPPQRPAIAPDGVDLTLIRWMLSLTPLERLRLLCEQTAAIERMRSRVRSGR